MPHQIPQSADDELATPTTPNDGTASPRLAGYCVQLSQGTVYRIPIHETDLDDPAAAARELFDDATPDQLRLWMVEVQKPEGYMVFDPQGNEVSF